MCFIRKDVLSEIGWSKSEIDNLRERTFKGDFTLDDLANLAKRIKDANVVENAMVHRPTPGSDWFAFIWANGGRVYDPATGKLVVSKSAAQKAFNYLDTLVNKLGVVPSSMINWQWPEIQQAVVSGEAGIFLTAGNWYWAGWMLPPYSLTEDYLFDNMTWMPIPAGKKGGTPVSVSHQMVTFLTSTSKNKDLAFRLITYSYAPDLLAESHLLGGYVATTKAELEQPEYQSSRWHKELSDIIPYMRQVPVHVKAPFYWESIFQAISAVETGSKSPSAALDFFVKRMEQEIGDYIIIED
jgi:inositol-phosphate transport system substrate-binding protein